MYAARSFVAMGLAFLALVSLVPGSLAVSDASGHGVRVSLKYGTPTATTLSVGYSVPLTVELWRYPEPGGNPDKVDVKTPDAYGQVYLRDVGLGELKRSGALIHYAVQAVKGGYIVGSFDWSAYVSRGYVESDVSLGIDSATASSVDILCAPLPGGYPTTSSIGVQPKGCGACSNSWVRLAFWTSAPTVVGELHTTSGMVSNFNYGQQSATSIDVVTSVTGTGWSVSGSVQYSNSLGWDVVWTADYLGGKQTVSQFNYQEDGWKNDCTYNVSEYKIYATQYNGGALWGSGVGGDNACPQDVSQGMYGNWAGYVSGSQGAYTVTEGVRYSAGVVLSGVAPNSGSLAIGITTAYQTHTKTSFTIGVGHVIWYAYSGTFNGWPKIYWTNDDVCRPSPSPAPSPSYPGDGGGGGGGGHPPVR